MQQCPYVGFDGRAHTGEMAIHKDYAVQIATVFERESHWVGLVCPGFHVVEIRWILMPR